MDIHLVRFANFEDRTLGRLTFGKHSWYTIEKAWRGNQPYISCIPEGVYRCQRVDSPKFGKNYWEITGIEGRSHILFHIANTADALSGCVGVGAGLYSDLRGVSRSKIGFGEFMAHTEGYTDLEMFIWKGAI